MKILSQDRNKMVDTMANGYINAKDSNVYYVTGENSEILLGTYSTTEKVNTVMLTLFQSQLTGFLMPEDGEIE